LGVTHHFTAKFEDVYRAQGIDGLETITFRFTGAELGVLSIGRMGEERPRSGKDEGQADLG
jgi:hypothetical protein